MDKQQARKLGGWVSLLAGICFVLGGIASIYIMFYMKPDTGIRVLVRLGRFFHS